MLIIDGHDFEIVGQPRQVTLVENKTNKRKDVMRLRGLFQKAGATNHNGRIYPRNILRQAIDDLQDKIKKRRAIGELDHACLTTDDFRVLTTKGWKEFKDIKIDDKVYSRVDGKIVISKVENIINELYSGKIYHVKGRHINSTFTAPHKFILDTRNDEGHSPKQIETTLEDIAQNRKQYNKCKIPRMAANDIHLDDRFLKITEDYHDGNIYCLTTTHGNFYMEQNGCSFWTGNCDAKIHLDRASHLITKVWMEGDDVFGEIEILDGTPNGRVLRGLINNEVQVGISSRGVGDVKSVTINGEEHFEVLPGYQLITWDVVAEPSVHDSYLVLAEAQNHIRSIKSKDFYEHQLVELLRKKMKLI